LDRFRHNPSSGLVNISEEWSARQGTQWAASDPSALRMAASVITIVAVDQGEVALDFLEPIGALVECEVVEDTELPTGDPIELPSFDILSPVNTSWAPLFLTPYTQPYQASGLSLLLLHNTLPGYDLGRLCLSLEATPLFDDFTTPIAVHTPLQVDSEVELGYGGHGSGIPYLKGPLTASAPPPGVYRLDRPLPGDTHPGSDLVVLSASRPPRPHMVVTSALYSPNRCLRLVIKHRRTYRGYLGQLVEDMAIPPLHRNLSPLRAERTSLFTGTVERGCFPPPKPRSDLCCLPSSP
jgi:hypothetical protein